MSKACARCEKTVYPLEELKCLDKIWHKGCFKCQECGMTLSMKTYKGFNKLPYCEAHIPKAKATTVAETPELKRIAENTKIQSNVQYHAEFEKNKAKFTQVADDPETCRLKKNTKIISNVAYHGDLERKAIMERKRSEPSDGEDGPAGNPVREDVRQLPPQQQQQQQQPQAPVQQHHPSSHSQPHHLAYLQAQQHQHHNLHQPHHPQHQQHHVPKQHHPYAVHPHPSPTSPAYNQHPSSAAPTSSSYMHHQGAPNANLAYHHHHHHPAAQNVFQDSNQNSPYSARNTQTLIYSSQTGPVQQQPTRHIGSIADYDPLNEKYGSLAQSPRGYAQGQPHGQYRQNPNPNYHQMQHANMYGDSHAGHHQQHSASVQNSNPAMQHKVNAPPTQLGRCYRAIYDYEAADSDEVSFHDGDLIVNCMAIDEGWMTGTIQRTGQTGMLPANYVQRVS